MQTLDEPILTDVFPAKVTSPAGEITDRCRAFLTRTRLLAYRDRKPRDGQRVELAVHVGIVDLRAEGRTWFATDTGGGEWRVEKGAWCGCGSRLRGMSRRALPLYDKGSE